VNKPARPIIGSRVPPDVGGSNQSTPAVVDPSLTVAHFTLRELDIIRKACRDSDFEEAPKLLAAAIKRGDGR
jgi:hypothetical protein